MPFRPTKKLLIAVPYYNHPELLYRTIGALAALAPAGRFDLTVTVSDDASPTAPDLSRIQPDPRFHYRRLPKNLGLVGNYNSCVELFRQAGPAWTLILDSDDVPTAESLRTVQSLSDRDSVAMIIGGYRIVNQARPDVAVKSRRLAPLERVLDPKAGFQWLYSRNRVASSGVWIHSDAYTGVSYDPDCPYCCDWELYMRLAGRFQTVLSDQIFCTVLHHEHNNTRGYMKSGESIRNERTALAKNWGLARELRLSPGEQVMLKTSALSRLLYRSAMARFLPR